MFTGIIEEIGFVKEFLPENNGAKLTIECHRVLNGTKIGDSICVNGVCQTVVDLTTNSFSSRISNETLNITTFKSFKIGLVVNLERALTLNSRIGGHIVTGHVDSCATISKIQRLNDFYDIYLTLPDNSLNKLIYKGSVAIDGISLTIAQVSGNIIKVAVIPHTFENTNLSKLVEGTRVNIETDIIGKYVEKLLNTNMQPVKKDISIDLLKENGFI